ncbi:glycoside hydrolase family 32 protein [Salimicrobium salexigens]|uniref:Sucrose-6-phosphate hydrolase n=1 Tax=Salimicrobium salexigens TaxID=908941 RepID=A0ABY1KS45_9BACI|nr:beta-fructofuranosidase [Salimicrobium salexigens]
MTETVMKNEATEEIARWGNTVKQDPYYPAYHIAPPVGLLNDPNGFIHWNGTYHLFYQWMPFHTGHGAKFWAHLTSGNLVDWEFHGPALAPDRWYDRSGCYSGSAVEKDGELILFYTGNVKNGEGERESYQCKVRSPDGVTFEKLGVSIELPKGFTPHFRDPKVWKTGDSWYMVIGAQTEDKEGCVVLYDSPDLESWQYKGILASGLGYMWECPDFFRLEGDVLLFSPQGLEEQGMDYRNMYQSGYIIGDFEDGFRTEDFRELDHGFEFYAPQTMEDDAGRRIIIGWMGMPDGGEEYFPTHDYHWIHQMTLPRELSQKGDTIVQKPLVEMEELRMRKVVEESQEKWEGKIPASSEILLQDIDGDVDIELFRYISLRCSKGKAILTRPAMDGSGEEWRATVLDSPLTEMRLFVDHSSIEIFINGGETVFSSRIFPEKEETSGIINGDLSLTVWELRRQTGGKTV